MEQIRQEKVDQAKKALDEFMQKSKNCEDREELHKHAVAVFSKDLDSPGLIKRACEAYNSNKSLYKFTTGFNKTADADFAILDPQRVADDVFSMHKTESVKSLARNYLKPRFYKEASAKKEAPMQKTASAESPFNPADCIELSDNPAMLEVDIVNTLDHQRDLIHKLAFRVDDAQTDMIMGVEPISRELGHLSKKASQEVGEIAKSYYGTFFDAIADLFPVNDGLPKYASAPRVPNTPVFEKIANYMKKTVIYNNRKNLLKVAGEDIAGCLKKLAGAYRLYKIQKRAGIADTALGVSLAPALRESLGLEGGDKAKVYNKLLNKNVQNALRELETRRNFYEVYADDYISTFPIDDVRTAYNVAIQKLPQRMRKHPSSATQLVRSWVTKMLSRGNVTSAEDADDVLTAAVNMRNEGFDINPYSADNK